MDLISASQLRSTPPSHTSFSIFSRSSTSSVTKSASPYPLGVFLATASLLLILLIAGPFCWHIRNRNIGLAFFIAWAILLLFFNTLNAMLWDASSFDFANHYDGIGLCDVEVKLQVSSQVGFPVSFFCVLRGLATVLDTKRTSVSKTDAEKKRTMLIDSLLCVFVPLVQMPLHFVVQPNRYYLFGISGCTPSTDSSWLALVLIILPPGIWLVIDGYLAVLILTRLLRYRKDFHAILASRQTSASRFMRIYLLCSIWLVASTIIWIDTLVFNAPGQLSAFSWSETHDPATWNSIIIVSSGGDKVFFDRWFWLIVGMLIFCFFGFGRDAWRTYRGYLVALGLVRWFPSLRREHSAGRQRSSLALAWSGSTAKLLRRVRSWMPAPVSSNSSAAAGSDASRSASVGATSPASSPPKEKGSRNINIDEATVPDSQLSPTSAISSSAARTPRTSPTPSSPRGPPSLKDRLTTFFSKTEEGSLRPRSDLEAHPLPLMSNQRGGVRSSITAEDAPPARLGGEQGSMEIRVYKDVVVETEIRDGGCE